MPLSMYDASVPVYTQTLTALKGVLQKGAAHAEARKIDPTVLLNARLFPDMFHLTRQVQIATDIARGTVARLAGQEPPAWEDNEKSFDEVIARVDRTLEYLASVRPADLEGSEAREIVRPVRRQPHKFTGLAYLQKFGTPNVYFHSATAYNILRHNGVEVGKMDFLGSLD